MCRWKNAAFVTDAMWSLCERVVSNITPRFLAEADVVISSSPIHMLGVMLGVKAKEFGFTVIEFQSV